MSLQSVPVPPSVCRTPAPAARLPVSLASFPEAAAPEPPASEQTLAVLLAEKKAKVILFMLVFRTETLVVITCSAMQVKRQQT